MYKQKTWTIMKLHCHRKYVTHLPEVGWAVTESVGERWRNQTANNSRGFKICPTIRTRHTQAIPRPYRLGNALNNSSRPIHPDIVNTFKPININVSFLVYRILFF